MFRILRTTGILPVTAFLFFSAVQTTFAQSNSSVEVVFNWPDGFVADYNVEFSSANISGYDATQLANANDPNLALSFSNFGSAQNPNYFLNVATYTGGHSGDGATFDFNSAPSNYWHEYIDTGSGWMYGVNGASNDILENGNRIGWVFGTENLPVPEPAFVGAISIFGGALLRRR